MSSDRLAKAISGSVARHQSRGLVDAAGGMTDVVIHGRVDMLAVAEDLLATSLFELQPATKSWAGWFVRKVRRQQQMRRLEQMHEHLSNRLDSANPAEAAIVRLKMRELGLEASPQSVSLQAK